MKLLVVGMNHRTSPLEVRERFAVDDPTPYLSKLKELPEIEEAVLISTCNRIEIVASTTQLDGARHSLAGFFQRELGRGESLPRSDHLAALLYEHHSGGAVRHIFRVASSIDSMVVGEPQILGQVKDAYRLAVEAAACGPILSRLFQQAFSTAKRVRTETRMAERPVSVARVAVDLARQIFEGLDEKSALLLGAGDMIELALDALKGAGLASVRVANRTRERAAALAERFDATPHGLDELPELLGLADVVLTCVGGDQVLLDRDLVAHALRARGNRPILVIDIGVPRNVDPAVDQLDNVYVYNLDDLAGVAEANTEERRRATRHAEGIVLEEQQRFDGWLAALEAVPTIRRIRARAEAVRQAEIERFLRPLSLGPLERDAVESLTRGIVNKILHAPISRLREERDGERGLAHLEAARSLFALDDAQAPGAKGEPGEDPRKDEE